MYIETLCRSPSCTRMHTACKFQPGGRQNRKSDTLKSRIPVVTKHPKAPILVFPQVRMALKGVAVRLAYQKTVQLGPGQEEAVVSQAVACHWHSG